MIRSRGLGPGGAGAKAAGGGGISRRGPGGKRRGGGEREGGRKTARFKTRSLARFRVCSTEAPPYRGTTARPYTPRALAHRAPPPPPARAREKKRRPKKTGQGLALWERLSSSRFVARPRRARPHLARAPRRIRGTKTSPPRLMAPPRGAVAGQAHEGGERDGERPGDNCERAFPRSLAPSPRSSPRAPPSPAPPNGAGRRSGRVRAPPLCPAARAARSPAARARRSPPPVSVRSSPPPPLSSLTPSSPPPLLKPRPPPTTGRSTHQSCSHPHSGSATANSFDTAQQVRLCSASARGRCDWVAAGFGGKKAALPAASLPNNQRTASLDAPAFAAQTRRSGAREAMGFAPAG